MTTVETFATPAGPTGPGAPAPSGAVVDLTAAAVGPSVVSGTIQSHGVLLAVDEPGGCVVMASANAAALLGIPADEATTLTLGEVVGAALADRILQHADADRGEPLLAALPEVPADPVAAGTLRGRVCDVAVHRTGHSIVVELEALAEDRRTLTYTSARAAMARLVGARTVPVLAERVAEEVRATTGFDRVTVHRFDQDGNGEVIAERRRDDLAPLVGLRYPAADVPERARRLSTMNWIRLVADVASAPVPIVPPHDPASGEPLDLALCSLRGASPIHLERLSAMGVTAAMSVSLIVDGQLWGLVSCHHHSGPHRPSHEARAAAEFLGQIASQMLAERERADVREKMHRHQRMLAELTEALVAAGDDVLEVLLHHPVTTAVMGASGVAMCFNDEVTTTGVTPPPEVCRRMAVLVRRPDGEAASTHHLATLAPDLADHTSTAAGVMVVGTADDRWLAWFRPELEQLVDWDGGRTDGDSPLSPRRSHEQWREVVRGQSAPWPAWKHDLANSVRTMISGLILHRSRDHLAVAESLQRTMVTDAVVEVRGLQVAARYEPASDYQLGGDWWDCLELPDGRVAFVVGDVAGHGVAAVAAMTQVRTALRAYLYAGTAPAESLDQLDRLMSGLMRDQVASALLVVIDPSTGDLEVVNAGHPAPLVFGDGPARALEGISRPLVGIGSGRGVPITAHLAPGATLLAYTDGLLERRGRDLASTQRMLLEAGGGGPEPTGVDLLEAWALDLTDAVPGDTEDDTTLLAIRRPR